MEKNYQHLFDRDKASLIPWLSVSLTSILLSTIVRLKLLTLNFDEGTSNLFFLITLFTCISGYIIIMATLEEIFQVIQLKIISPSRKIKYFKNNFFSEETKIFLKEEVKIKKQPVIQKIYQEETILNVDQIRKQNEKENMDRLNNEIFIFRKYTRITFAPYLTNDEITVLEKCIEFYIRKENFDVVKLKINNKKLKNVDLFRFGWNMGNHFKITENSDVAYWLMKVFKNIEKLEFSYIYKKLYDEKGKQIIKNIKDIPEYLKIMEEQNK